MNSVTMPVPRFVAHPWPFIQNGDFFQWKAVAAEYTNGSPGTSAIIPAISVPSGLKLLARVSVAAVGAEFFYRSDLDTNDTTPGAAVVSVAGSGNPTGGVVNVMTNANAQIRLRCQAGATAISLSTQGYWDLRGKG